MRLFRWRGLLVLKRDRRLSICHLPRPPQLPLSSICLSSDLTIESACHSMQRLAMKQRNTLITVLFREKGSKKLIFVSRFETRNRKYETIVSKQLMVTTLMKTFGRLCEKFNLIDSLLKNRKNYTLYNQLAQQGANLSVGQKQQWLYSNFRNDRHEPPTCQPGKPHVTFVVRWQ